MSWLTNVPRRSVRILAVFTAVLLVLLVLVATEGVASFWRRLGGATFL